MVEISNRQGILQENVKIIRRIQIIVRNLFDVFIIYVLDLRVRVVQHGKIH